MTLYDLDHLPADQRQAILRSTPIDDFFCHAVAHINFREVRCPQLAGHPGPHAHAEQVDGVNLVIQWGGDVEVASGR